MKRFVFVITMVYLLLMLPSSGEAWKVAFHNQCDFDISIAVTGQHLFWEQVDCNVVAKPGQRVECVMPGAICPVSIEAKSSPPGKEIYESHIDCVTGLPHGACCWDVFVRAYQGEYRCYFSITYRRW